MRHLLITIAVLAAPAMEPEYIEIAEPMLYHGTQFYGTSGEWWGLYELDDGEFILQKTPVRVEIVHNPISDAPGEKTGRLVKASRLESREPVHLFRGVEDLEEGHVENLARGWRSLDFDEKLQLTYEAPYFELEATGHIIAAHTPEVDVEYTIHLNRYDEDCELTQSQVVFSMSRLGETFPFLLWAGDLDRDGIPDMIFDLTYHYNVRLPTLFLSGGSEPGQMVRKAAELESWGC